jgi:hypothetical protein
MDVADNPLQGKRQLHRSVDRMRKVPLDDHAAEPAMHRRRDRRAVSLHPTQIDAVASASIGMAPAVRKAFSQAAPRAARWARRLAGRVGRPAAPWRRRRTARQPLLRHHREPRSRGRRTVPRSVEERAVISRIVSHWWPRHNGRAGEPRPSLAQCPRMLRGTGPGRGKKEGRRGPSFKGELQQLQLVKKRAGPQGREK